MSKDENMQRIISQDLRLLKKIPFWNSDKKNSVYFLITNMYSTITILCVLLDLPVFPEFLMAAITSPVGKFQNNN